MAKISAADRKLATKLGKDGDIDKADRKKLQDAGYNGKQLQRLDTQAHDGAGLTKTETKKISSTPAGAHSSVAATGAAQARAGAKSASLPIEGRQLVTQSPSNQHKDGHVRQQKGGYDFVGIDKQGRVTKGDASKLKNYVGYGRDVKAPVSGKVVAAVDGYKDHKPGKAKDSKNPAGNHLLIKTDDGKYTLVAHLKKGSVNESLEGRRVKAGQTIGKVGNSGRSSGPHVHVHTQTTKELFGNTDAKAVAMTYSNYTVEGRYDEPSAGTFSGWHAGHKKVKSGKPKNGQVVHN